MGRRIDEGHSLLHIHDFVTECVDTNITRRRVESNNWTRAKKQLKPNVVPSIFPNMPGYFTHEAEERPTGATTSIRQQNVNARFEQMETELFSGRICFNNRGFDRETSSSINSQWIYS